MGNDGVDMSPPQAGLADGGGGDVAPLDRPLHAVEGHAHKHTVLRKRQKGWSPEEDRQVLVLHRQVQAGWPGDAAALSLGRAAEDRGRPSTGTSSILPL